MSLRESKQPREKEPAEEEHTPLTEQEPATALTKIAEGSVLESLHQIRGDNGDDPVLNKVAKVLERDRPRLNHQEWYTLLQTVRDSSNRNKEVDQILKEIATGHGPASTHIEQGGFCKILLYLCNSVVVVMFILLAFAVALKANDVKLGKFDVTNFFMLNPESARQWEQLDRNSVRILVTGKTGTGKSALINGLIGDNVAQEGDTLDPTTSEVQEVKQMVHGISLSIFDSPGLQDGTSREDEYLLDMQKKCEKVDLVLYTIKMTDQRINVEDTDAMEKLTEAFGYEFWKKAMFVMTFANEIRSPEYPEDKHENRKFFDERLQLWKDSLPVFVEHRSNIPIDIGKEVPIVPAGYYKMRDLPGRKFWFSQFWKAALDRMMESSAEGAGYMLQFSKDRLKNYNDTSEEDFQKPIHEQPILSKIVDEA